MKVLQLIHAQQRRGAEVFAVQLSDALRRLGVDVRVVALYRSSLQSDKDRLDLGPGGRCLGHASSSFMDRLFTVDPRVAWNIRKILGDWQPDILQMNGGRTLKYGVWASAGMNQKPALVYRKIGNSRNLRRFPWKQYYRSLFKMVDGVVAVSHFDLREFQNLSMLMPSTRVTVIPTGIDPQMLDLSGSDRTPAWSASEEDVLLFVGRLSEEKSPEGALHVLRLVKEKMENIQLWFVGDGPLREVLEQKARDMGLSSRVRLWGVQKHLAPFYCQSKVLLVTSVIEGVPGVILEAGYLGIPVVATRVGGIPECVRDGETGFLFEYGNWKQGAEWVLNLLQNESLRQRMGNAASAWVRSRFLMEHVAKEYLNFYENLLKARHSGSH